VNLASPMYPTATTAPRRPWASWPGFGVLSLLTVLGGLYLDGKQNLSITDLYVAFYVTSLAGAAFGIWPFIFAAWGPRARFAALIAAIILWRIAYFPVFVLAGWVATWFDWFAYAADLSVAAIYPVFLFAIFAMHLTVASVSLLMVLRRVWLLLIPGIPLLVLAILVSFNRPADIRVLPDRAITREPEIPSRTLPQGNVYAGLLTGGEYNLAQQVLLYSGLILYELIPAAPWSSTVKHIIAQGVLENPSGSTADRIYEHYLAYLIAQPCVRRGEKCSRKNSG